MMHLSSSAWRKALIVVTTLELRFLTITSDFGIVIFKWHSLKLGELLELQH